MKRRISYYLRTKASHGYGPVNAFVTRPIPQAHSAEPAALTGWGTPTPASRTAAKSSRTRTSWSQPTCAEMNVWRHAPHRDDDV